MWSVRRGSVGVATTSREVHPLGTAWWSDHETQMDPFPPQAVQVNVIVTVGICRRPSRDCAARDAVALAAVVVSVLNEVIKGNSTPICCGRQPDKHGAIPSAERMGSCPSCRGRWEVASNVWGRARRHRDMEQSRTSPRGALRAE